ncbi:MAG: SoxR reducing system RseC family protein [Bacteroidales bacterium]|jgi:sigma-E factor negative regulatory protein RseC|nr:SoxR reducing system RseC family protein [Bacteroidales bacterium]MDD4703504.1 SoxR reducing system RseC family protein [Bacteroidales bacterium]MDX9798086.1 SoxR reducing system RseC family protein [Bacteroidales bacterium]
MSETIEHKGRVSDIQDNKIIVTIISKSMCASCHAKGACISGDSKEKIIEVKTSNLSNYIIGDEITVCLERKIGFKAVLIGFFFPFLVLISVFILAYIFISPNSEIITAAISLSAVTLYYFIIYLLRNKIEKEFHFKIK